MTSYRDLEIYKQSKRLAIEVHSITLLLPRFELYEEGSQARRSSKAVTAIIVEGYAKSRYKNEFIKYLIYAIAECDETIVHLDFLFETKSWNDEKKYNLLRDEYVLLSKRINKYLQWVEHHWNS